MTTNDLRRAALVELAKLGQLRGGDYSIEEAPGAHPNGTCVVKINSEADDAHEDGALATVIGSLGPMPYEGRDEYAYFIVWDDAPYIAFAIRGKRLRKATIEERAAPMVAPRLPSDVPMHFLVMLGFEEE